MSAIAKYAAIADARRDCCCCNGPYSFYLHDSLRRLIAVGNTFNPGIIVQYALINFTQSSIAVGNDLSDQIAAQFVMPYRKSGKNDANDAEAICEALSRPNMRFVPVKTVDHRLY